MVIKITPMVDKKIQNFKRLIKKSNFFWTVDKEYDCAAPGDTRTYISQNLSLKVTDSFHHCGGIANYIQFSINTVHILRFRHRHRRLITTSLHCSIVIHIDLSP
jgi:hypothetical protein